MPSSSKCTCEYGKCDKISAVSEQLGYVEMAVNVDIYGSTSGKFGELEHTLADTEYGCRKVR